jgi:hypothetical protein
LRAEAKAGRVLTKQAKEGKRRKGGDPKSTAVIMAPTLGDLDISPQESSDWQVEGKVTH